MEETKNKILTRQTLLIKVRDRYDEASWKDFNDYYGAYIFAVLKGMGVEFSDIEDLKQSVLLKLWKNLPEFDYNPDKGTFRSWLCTIVRNTAIDYFKKKKTLSDENQDLAIGSEIDELIEKEWMIHIANLAWDNIKNEFNDRVVDIYMRLSGGDSPNKIAEETGTLKASIYVYKERVQKSLRKEVRRLVKELS